MEIIPKTELAYYENQIKEAETVSTELEVKSDDGYVFALGIVKGYKERLELINARQNDIIKPLKDSIKSINDLFKPKEKLENAIRIIKAKMIAYNDAKEAKAEDKIDKIEARLEKGTISQAEASVKTYLAQVPKTVSSDSASSTVKKVKKYYVTDKSKIPLDFLEPDMVRIKASFKAGMPVPGVEERLESELAIK